MDRGLSGPIVLARDLLRGLRAGLLEEGRYLGRESMMVAVSELPNEAAWRATPVPGLSVLSGFF
jgi:hypothetical protein